MNESRRMRSLRVLLWKLSWSLLGLVGASSSLVADDDLWVSFADEAIVLDGVPEEQAWTNTGEIGGLRSLVQGENQNQPDVVTSFLWDREHLYIFVKVETVQVGSANAIDELSGKSLHLYLKPSIDHSGLYHFTLAANRSNRFRFFEEMDNEVAYELPYARAVSKVEETSSGIIRWTAEARISWVELIPTGGRPAPDELWRVWVTQRELSSKENGNNSDSDSDATFQDGSPLRGTKGYGINFDLPQAGDLTTALRLEGKPPGIQSNMIGQPGPPKRFAVERVNPSLSLRWPIFIANEPGTDRYLAIEEEGPYARTRLVRVHDLTNPDSAELLIDLTDVAYSLCFHPDFERNGFFYLGSNGSREGGTVMSRVTRYKLARGGESEFIPESAKIIIEWPSNGHNGAAVCFGADGMLYVTTGDGTSDSDRNVVGQGLDHLLAKVLRIDVDHPSDGRAYRVPKDNPFVDRPNARGETWVYGLRNPWRITSDPKSGQLWVGNNGQDLWEQVYLLKRGANYGWSVYEGSHPFYPNRVTGADPIQPPTLEHPHSDARSLTGGVVYRGTRFPELRGAYVYGDYSTGKIWAARASEDGRIEWQAEIADTQLQLTSFALDAAGELLMTDHQAPPAGGLYTLKRIAPTRDVNAFPRKLTETGLFEELVSHTMARGILPYDVNSPLWSDGAFKARFIALPAASETAETIQYREAGPWGLPEGTVLIKSFGLEQVNGDPSTRRWIETRLMLLQQGEWTGFSYRWNKEQTDGVLVSKAGEDHTFELEKDGEQRSLKWHYPSRTECMVCHSRAAGFVLGITTPQLNRDYAYGLETTHNQLEMFEHLGVLNVDWKTAIPRLIEYQAEMAPSADKGSKPIQISTTPLVDQRAFASTSILPVSVSKLSKLADPYDDQEPLDLRARSYLQTNCAHCHVEAGGGNAKIDLAFNTSLEKTRLLGVTPLHHSFGLPQPKLIAPGRPSHSILLHRMSIRSRGQMPQLSTELVDQAAVAMIADWIKSMDAGSGLSSVND